MKTILVPIDFSALSQQTAQFGLQLAERVDARLLLLHIVQPSPPVPAFNVPIVELSSWNDTLFTQMTQAIEQFKQELAHYQQQHGYATVTVDTKLAIGQPADGILEVASTEKASYIVLGTVGASNAWDRWMGSVAVAVTSGATCPVWVLPHAVQLSSLQRIVYFADLDGREVSCINRVLNLSERLGAKLDVVHVSPVVDEEYNASEAIIESFEEIYPADKLSFHHLAYEKAAEGIEGYVQRHWPDAVVLAHRQRGFIENLFHSSVIRQVALTTKRPLLIVPKQNFTS